MNPALLTLCPPVGAALTTHMDVGNATSRMQRLPPTTLSATPITPVGAALSTMLFAMARDCFASKLVPNNSHRTLGSRP
jgi:hypothetical protein